MGDPIGAAQRSITGEGDDAARSDKFYHWGALLGLVSLMDAGLAGPAR